MDNMASCFKIWETQRQAVPLLPTPPLGESGCLAAVEFALPMNSIFADASSIPKLIMNEFLTSHEEKVVLLLKISLLFGRHHIPSPAF